jgi:leader peptidase (prepilin peptidase) / N-methyltransferase
MRGDARVTRAEVVKRSLVCAAGVFAVAASLHVAPGVARLAGVSLALIMLAVAVIDWGLLVIPDELNALAAVLGVAAVGFERWGVMPAPVLHALTRGAVTAALFFAFRFLYRQLRGREGIGLGDVKLAGVAGIWLDWTSLTVAVDIAALTALGFVASRVILLRRPPDPRAKLPFGTFFAPAIWLCWLLARW